MAHSHGFTDQLETLESEKKIPQETKKVRKVFHGFVYATMEIDSPIQGKFTKKLLLVIFEPGTFDIKKVCS